MNSVRLSPIASRGSDTLGGCGKSTLLQACGALLRPTGGTMLVAEADPDLLSANARNAFRAENIGCVFQQFHLVPYLDLLQKILTANVPNLCVHRKVLAKFAELLNLLQHVVQKIHVPRMRQKVSFRRPVYAAAFPRSTRRETKSGNEPEIGRLASDRSRR